MVDVRHALRTHHLLVTLSKLQPRVSQQILRARSLIWVLVEDLEQQLLGGSRHVVLEWQLLLADVLIELLVVLAFERKPSAKESVQEDTQRPDISGWACVFYFTYDFRCHVRGRATENLDFFLVRNASRESEVDELDPSPGFVQQNIFQLDVSMRHVPLVQVVDTKHDLLPQEFGLDLGHLAVGFALEVTMEGASVDVLHDQEHLLVRLECLVEFGQAVVVDLLHDFYFPFYTFPAVRLKQLELVVNLDCNFLVQQLVQADSDNGVCTLADPLSNYVVVDVLNGAELGAELVRLSVQIDTWIL